MTRYAALLRGIAPSNPNMANDKLRGVFSSLGFTRVASVLASGNIVFDTDAGDVTALEDRIQNALQGQLGIGGGTIVRTHDELRELLNRDPFEGRKHGRSSYLIATFVKDGVHEDPEKKLPKESDPLTEVIGYDAAARAFLTVIDNSEPGKTPDFMVWLERAYGKDITTRTWLTVQRIVKKMES